MRIGPHQRWCEKKVCAWWLTLIWVVNTTKRIPTDFGVSHHAFSVVFTPFFSHLLKESPTGDLPRILVVSTTEKHTSL